MDFEKAIRIIVTHLKKENPKTFSCSWILKHSPSSYRYLQKNLRSEDDRIDWDRFTIALPRKYAKRWIRYKRKVAKPYENQDELNIIITKYQDKIKIPEKEKPRVARGFETACLTQACRL